MKTNHNPGAYFIGRPTKKELSAFERYHAGMLGASEAMSAEQIEFRQSIFIAGMRWKAREMKRK